MITGRVHRRVARAWLLLWILGVGCVGDRLESGGLAFPTSSEKTECLRSLRPTGFFAEPQRPRHPSLLYTVYWSQSASQLELSCDARRCALGWTWWGEPPSLVVVDRTLADARAIRTATVAECGPDTDEFVCVEGSYGGCP